MAEDNAQFNRGRFEGEVLSRLGALDQKLDAFVAGQTDHERRIRSLEDDRNKVRGIAAAVAAVVGAIVTAVGWIVQTRFH